MFINTSYRKILNPYLEKIKKSTPPPLWRGIATMIRPLLCETWFSAVSFSNIVMWNLGIKYYLLFLE